MKISRIKINNFRGIKESDLFLPDHGVFIGDNNTGKTTILEAIELVLGPDRLNRRSVVDEHDFFGGEYTTVEIKIEVYITNLSEEQERHFHDQIEFWDTNEDKLYEEPDPTGVDKENIVTAVRVLFVGGYDEENDDFYGETFYSSLYTDRDSTKFYKKDKFQCGFLYLRSLRTGTRALSLERGSLLDIILRNKEMQLKVWEKTISELDNITVASDPDLGVSGILESISKSLKKYVPKEWGTSPKLKISNLTREELRKVITAFISTGVDGHSAPFYRQGTGSVNLLVLAMLSQIAVDKQNVIFAMEEPETAIPPHTQKRIVHEIRKLSSQTLFTSHSPYVLEEFGINETVVLSRNNEGKLEQNNIQLPQTVKAKRYRQEFRTRFCEALLSRKVLIAEGATEAQSFPSVCRRLYELNPEVYSPIEALGVCVVDAGGETNIADMAKIYKDLGKQVFAICDKQVSTEETKIVDTVDNLFMHQEDSFEDLVLKNTPQSAIDSYATKIVWPQYFIDKYKTPETQAGIALSEYFATNKADYAMADFLSQLNESDIPQWLKDKAIELKNICEPEEELDEEIKEETIKNETQ